MNLSYFLKMVRTNAGLSQRDLSMKTGIATTLLSRYENGRVVPRPETLNRIAQGIGIPLANFFDVQDEAEGGEPKPTSRAAYEEASGHSMMLSILEGADDLFLQGGECHINKGEIKKIWFPFNSVVRGLSIDRLVGHFVMDSSMEKQFKRGSLILVDVKNKQPASGHFLCLLVKGQLLIRLVTAYSKSDTTFMATDLNDLMPSMTMKPRDFSVVGTVVWKSELM